MKKRALGASAFAFAEPPQKGLAISIAGQRYDLVDIEPYRRIDGEMTEVSVWMASCRGCGLEFLHRTARLRFPELRNCPNCRPPHPWRRGRVMKMRERMTMTESQRQIVAAILFWLGGFLMGLGARGLM